MLVTYVVVHYELIISSDWVESDANFWKLNLNFVLVHFKLIIISFRVDIEPYFSKLNLCFVFNALQVNY
jgi:hypothetical protein